MFKKRSAQATLYIIVGLVLLIIVLGVSYYTGILTKTGIIGEKPSEPVTAFTELCVKKISEQGITTLGQQGGYIYLDKFPLGLEDVAPFNSPLLKVSDYQKIPYWFYQKEAGLDRTEMPKLEKTSTMDNSIQDQLERYITENLPICLNNFKAFKEQGTLVEPVEPSASITTNVIFTDEDVVINVNYPIIIKKDEKEGEKGGESKKLENFNANIKARVKKTYEFAKEIAAYEQTTTFLEQNTMNLVTIYGRVDKDYLPPIFGGMEIRDCGDMVYWMEDDVNSMFKQVLNLNLPFLKLQNSEVEKIIVDNKQQSDKEKQATSQGIFDMMVKSTSEKNKYPGMNVLFEYKPNFPLYLSVGQKGMIRPPTQVDFNYLFGRKCVFVYKFPYSFKYPVLVTLVDKKSSISQQPFMFQFPLQVVTKANFPRIAIKDALNLASPEKETYLCSVAQRTSGESTVTVLDKETTTPLSDAMVYYQCGPSFVEEFDENGTLTNSTPFSEKCFIGKTDNTGKFTSKFPPCWGGAMLSVEKPHYAEDSVLLGDVSPSEKFTTALELSPMTKLTLNLKKYYVIPPVDDADISAATSAGTPLKQGVVIKDGQVVACNLYTLPGDLDKNEEAVVTLRKIDPTFSSSNPYTISLYNPNELPEIELAPGTYQVDIMLIKNQKWKGELDIKKNQESIHISGTLIPYKASKDIYYPDETQEVESLISGGSQYTTVISEESLKGAKEMILFVFDEGKPAKIKDYFGAMGHREACSLINYNKVQPAFEK